MWSGGSLESIETLPKDLDVVIHGASTVSFDPPIDEAFDTNVGGAIGLYGALLASGGDPHVVHVSTCYVGGIRKGIQPESALTHDVDVLAEYDAARSARARVELESREPQQLRQFLAASKARHGKAGPQAVAQFAEEARSTGCASGSSTTAAPAPRAWAGRTSTRSRRRSASGSRRPAGPAPGTACRSCARRSSRARCTTPSRAGSTASRSPTR